MTFFTTLICRICQQIPYIFVKFSHFRCTGILFDRHIWHFLWWEWGYNDAECHLWEDACEALYQWWVSTHNFISIDQHSNTMHFFYFSIFPYNGCLSMHISVTASDIENMLYRLEWFRVKRDQVMFWSLLCVKGAGYMLKCQCQLGPIYSKPFIYYTLVQKEWTTGKANISFLWLLSSPINAPTMIKVNYTDQKSYSSISKISSSTIEEFFWFFFFWGGGVYFFQLLCQLSWAVKSLGLNSSLSLRQF